MLFAAGPLARGPERPRLSSELSSSAARHLAATRRNHKANGRRLTLWSGVASNEGCDDPGHLESEASGVIVRYNGVGWPGE